MTFGRRRLFVRFLLPCLVGLNLVLGLVSLSVLGGRHRLYWADLVAGAFFLLMAGWLAGSWWSRRYWMRAMTRQVRTWRLVVDVLFGWIEELPLSHEALRHLKRSLDRVL